MQGLPIFVVKIRELETKCKGFTIWSVGGRKVKKVKSCLLWKMKFLKPFAVSQATKHQAQTDSFWPFGSFAGSSPNLRL